MSSSFVHESIKELSLLENDTEIKKGNDGMRTVKVRPIANEICELFEDLLDKHNIDIPDEDREWNEGEAHIYGMTYAELEDKVKEILVEFAEQIKRDNVELEEYEYQKERMINYGRKIKSIIK